MRQKQLLKKNSPLPGVEVDTSGVETSVPLESPSGDGEATPADGEAEFGGETESGFGFALEGAGAGDFPPLAGEGSGTAPAGKEPGAGDEPSVEEDSSPAGELSFDGGLLGVDELLVPLPSNRPPAAPPPVPLPFSFFPLLPLNSPFRPGRCGRPRTFGRSPS
jgi:hypothetical protein